MCSYCENEVPDPGGVELDTDDGEDLVFCDTNCQYWYWEQADKATGG